jgi:hypothetical protein
MGSKADPPNMPKMSMSRARQVSFEDVAQLIPDAKTGVLDFIVTDDNAHLFVITKDASLHPALNTYTIKIERKSLAEKVERFRGRSSTSGSRRDMAGVNRRSPQQRR